MMYYIFRILLGFLCFSVCFYFIRKSGYIYKKRIIFITAILASVVTVVISFLPVENGFISFETPESVFEYTHLEKADYVVVGENTACVISEGSNKFIDAFAIKGENGWKLSVGFDKETVIMKSENDYTIFVFRHKKTDEHYIAVWDFDKKLKGISDGLNSKFYLLNDSSDAYDNLDYYLAYIKNFDNGYYVIIDGKQIMFEE